MSTLKHIDKEIIVREIFSFPGDPMTLAQGGGYPLEQSSIDHIINNGVNCLSFSELSDALRLILQSVDGESSNIYEGIPPVAIDLLEKLIEEWSAGGAGNGRQIYLADDCIEEIFSLFKPGLPSNCLTLPEESIEIEMWEINKDLNTATISDGKDGTFIIEFDGNELELMLADEENLSEHTMGLDDQETYGYFYSDDELQFIMNDVKNFIVKINDLVRKYDEKYVLKLY